MTKSEFIKELVKLDPYYIVATDLDGFSPYAYVDRSRFPVTLIEELEDLDIDDILMIYLTELEQNGFHKEEMEILLLSEFGEEV